MQKKIKVGILGATGMVGQNYISLLENHPWFEVSFLAASKNSAGKKYSETISGRWLMDKPANTNILNQQVYEVENVEKAKECCNFVFSAFEISDKEEIKRIEKLYAKNDLPVVSNASAHRNTDDVPVLIPEINHSHLEIIKIQQKKYGWNKGFIVVKPNCSIQSFMIPIYALMQKGYNIDKIIITTLQAVSGAGYPGVPSLDVIDNIIPYIGGEEEKTNFEPLKIFGKINNNVIENAKFPLISSTCTRVGVSNGHTAVLNLKFSSNVPTLEEIINIWENFKSIPQELNLPFAPDRPIQYLTDPKRPQPLKDRNYDKAMGISIGRLRKCDIFDIKFVGLSHNTVRGAAGGGILNAELLVKKGYIN